MMSQMDLALAEAEAAAARGEVPVGAVVTDARGTVLAAAGNRVEEWRNPAAHAEMLVLREASARTGTKFLVDCTLTVTLEPCPMCAAAIALYRVKRLVFGAYDPKSGGVEHGPRMFSQPVCHYQPEVIGGVAERRSGELLQKFFTSLR